MESDTPHINKIKNRMFYLSPVVQARIEHEPRLSDFEDLKHIGDGSFAQVFQAVNKSTNKIFALKRINKE